MGRSLAKFSESEASNHTPSLADFTTTTPELKFSVHIGPHASIPGEGCAGLARRRAGWTNSLPPNSRRGYITNMFEFDLRQAQGASARNMREHRPPPRSVQCASQYAPCEEFGGGFASGPVSCEQRLRAAAISAVTMGQCTTSAMPENIKLLIFISSVDFVASTIGRWGAASCSAAANSSDDLVDPRWPTISTSNRSGAARHAANAASAAVNPTGS